VAWSEHLSGDPLPWLLGRETPAVRAATLQRLCDRPADDVEVVAARAEAMRADPIRSILEAQDPEGWWVKPGAGYAPKYTGTVWELMFLDQLGADPADARVQRACDYVLCHTAAASGGFGATGAGDGGPPPPSRVIHCLNGNLVRALIGLGRWGDPRLRAAVEWAGLAADGDGGAGHELPRTGGPAFMCAYNGGNPCAWGAVKELLGLARVPPDERSDRVCAAIDQGVELLLSRDPAVADYPTARAGAPPSGSWFKLGFPAGYVTDVLQNLEVLAELGHAGEPRLAGALSWVESQQEGGRWSNRYAYNGKTLAMIERQGQPSKWVTLRACTVLKAAWEQGWSPPRSGDGLTAPTAERAGAPRSAPGPPVD
jgi:hypothetical protein